MVATKKTTRCKKRKGASQEETEKKKRKKERRSGNPFVLDEAEESDGIEEEEELEAEDWRPRDSEGNLFIRFVRGKLEVLSDEYYELSKKERKRVRIEEREFVHHYGLS